jgi:hypothetical protein
MEKTMMLYTTATGGVKTFALIPLNANCPFNEAIYMPNLEALAVLGKTNRDTFTMMERLDENGNPTPQSGKGADATKPKVHRVQISSPWEYFVHEKDEIKEFVRNNAVNADSYDYLQYMKSESDIEVVKTIIS